MWCRVGAVLAVSRGHVTSPHVPRPCHGRLSPCKRLSLILDRASTPACQSTLRSAKPRGSELRDYYPTSASRRQTLLSLNAHNTWQEFYAQLSRRKMSSFSGQPVYMYQREWCRLAVGVVGEQWDALSILAGAEDFLKLVLHLPGFCFEPWVAIRGKEYCLDGAR